MRPVASRKCDVTLPIYCSCLMNEHSTKFDYEKVYWTLLPWNMLPPQSSFGCTWIQSPSWLRRNYCDIWRVIFHAWTAGAVSVSVKILSWSHFIKFYHLYQASRNLSWIMTRLPGFQIPQVLVGWWVWETFHLVSNCKWQRYFRLWE